MHIVNITVTKRSKVQNPCCLFNVKCCLGESAWLFPDSTDTSLMVVVVVVQQDRVRPQSSGQESIRWSYRLRNLGFIYKKVFLPSQK